jgi:DNA-binding NtrC family response regulator
MHKILVVNDELGIVKVLAEFLGRQGFEVVTALGGKKALEILSSDAKIELMILDIKMPKLKGTDILKEISRRDKKIPAIILTGSIDIEKYIDDLRELGYTRSDVLLKPVDLYLLLDLVKKKLNLKSR